MHEAVHCVDVKNKVNLSLKNILNVIIKIYILNVKIISGMKNKYFENISDY